MNAKRVTIIGAGFSGLSLAHECLKRGLQVEIYDKLDHVGGLISSPETPYGFYETAANAFLGTEYIEDFLKENNVTYVVASRAAQKRFIFRGKPRRWPFGMLGTLKLIFLFLRCLAKGKIWRMPKGQESITDWGQRCFGPEATEFILNPALQGIYAGDPNRLSADLILGAFFRKKAKKARRTSPMISGVRGMGSILEALHRSLENRGVRFHFCQEFTSEMISRCKNSVVIATNGKAAGQLLAGIPESNEQPQVQANAKILAQIEMLPILTVTAFYAKPPRKYQGFGILFPPSQGYRALGLLMTSLTFQRDLPSFTETWIFGGAGDLDVLNCSDEEISAMIAKERLQIFGEDQKPLDLRLTRWPKALPHYTKDWAAALSELHAMKNIFLHGNYLGAIGLSRILEKSIELAQVLKLGQNKAEQTKPKR